MFVISFSVRSYDDFVCLLTRQVSSHSVHGRDGERYDAGHRRAIKSAEKLPFTEARRHVSNSSKVDLAANNWSLTLRLTSKIARMSRDLRQAR